MTTFIRCRRDYSIRLRMGMVWGPVTRPHGSLIGGRWIARCRTFGCRMWHVVSGGDVRYVRFVRSPIRVL